MKTTKTHVLLASAIAAAIAVPALTGAQPAPAPKFEAEKCYGIAKAGKNDCQTAELLVRGDVEARRPAATPGSTSRRVPPAPFVNGNSQPRA